MKKDILKIIYNSYERWASQVDIACRKGCGVCCTQDVMTTSIESDLIIDFVRENSMERWFVEKLEGHLPGLHHKPTTNEFAQACLSGQDIDPGSGSFSETCPFLEDDLCSIYEARPFGCRSFFSTTPCKPGSSAAVPRFLMSGATAIDQIIEHLDQGSPWGNMLHLLYLKAHQKPAFHTFFKTPENLQIATYCSKAKPLPGFLIDNEDYPHVLPLLDSIFDTEVAGRKVEDILNNR
ncbi:MAG: hypothetical protein D6B25_09315 [Desulfobulbaceae bacterium]|nr:MAG: hypothetical protein D6B25_09315 [Desulfobulbaceae bacterium]